MADTKISALTALTGANVDTANDLLPIVDTSASSTKKILVDELRNAIGPVLSTEQASTSGTSIDFTSIPSWVKRIVMMLDGVSTNGTSALRVQIGDSGGIETSAYTTTYAVLQGASAVTVGTATAGFDITSATAATELISGQMTLTLEDSTNTWIASGVFQRVGTAQIWIVSGSKATSATLDRVRLTTANGTDTFDAGGVNILYE